MRSSFQVGILGLASLAALLVSTPADACGGVFFPPAPTETQVTSVRGHEMIVSLSPVETIVWDRVELTGPPSEFAYVVPMRPNARLELAGEGLFTGLRQATAPTVRGPTPPPPESGGGCGFGCGSLGGAESGSAAPGGNVKVISRSNVGPYASVHLRARDGATLPAWLRENGYAVPDKLAPMLAAYAADGFDFVALKLRPGAEGPQPLRLRTPGADPTLPLRMSRAGVGDRTALTLYILGDGRWRVAGYPEEAFNGKDLTINRGTRATNYQALLDAQLREGDGRKLIVERSGFIQPPTFPEYGCFEDTLVIAGDAPSGSDAGSDASTDASADARVTDADADAGETDAGETDADVAADPPKSLGTHEVCGAEEWSIAAGGRYSGRWVTRLSASLPESAFEQDMRFEASPTQLSVDGVYLAREVSGSTASVSPVRPSYAGTFVVWAATIAGVARLLRRRRS